MAESRVGAFGRRVYRALFTFLGPAQVGRYTPSEPHRGESAALPAGYHFESYVDDSGIRRRIAVPGDATGPKQDGATNGDGAKS